MKEFRLHIKTNISFLDDFWLEELCVGGFGDGHLDGF